MNEKYHVLGTKKYHRDVKRLAKKHYDIKLLTAAVKKIAEANKNILVAKYNDHSLSGDLQGYRDLHILDNWILLYQVDEINHEIYLVRTGTHDQLF